MTTTRRDVSIVTADATLAGEVWLPPDAPGIVLFAHGSGSSRLSPRNSYVAEQIVGGGIGTLLFDLLTVAEERRDRLDASRRFDIGLLTERLAGATRWLDGQDWARSLTRGYFGDSTGAAAALQAAAALGKDVQAVVSRGGRPDLAGAHDLGPGTARAPRPAGRAGRRGSAGTWPFPKFPGGNRQHPCSR